MTDWKAIVAGHGPAVWRVVYRILAHHADAWDCYQEVFLEAFRSAPRTAVRDWVRIWAPGGPAGHRPASAADSPYASLRRPPPSKSRHRRQPISCRRIALRLMS